MGLLVASSTICQACQTTTNLVCDVCNSGCCPTHSTVVYKRRKIRHKDHHTMRCCDTCNERES